MSTYVYLNGYRDTGCLVWTVMVCSVFVECYDVSSQI